MPNPLQIADAVDLVDASIQQIWLKDGAVKDTYYDKYMNTETGVTDYYLKDSSLGGLGYASRVTENAVIQSQSPIQGFDQVYTQHEYGKVLPITKRMWFFGIKKRNLEQVVQQLRDACAHEREKLCAELLENGFITSYTHSDDGGNYTINTTGGDAKSLFSSSHTREDAGTNNNNVVYDGINCKCSAVKKSSLINGENLKRKAMATLRKAMSHLQRLNEMTLFREATVPSYMKI